LPFTRAKPVGLKHGTVLFRCRKDTGLTEPRNRCLVELTIAMKLRAWNTIVSLGRREHGRSGDRYLSTCDFSFYHREARRLASSEA